MDKEITCTVELIFLIVLLYNWVIYKNARWNKLWGLGEINILDLVLAIILWSCCLEKYKLINNLSIKAGTLQKD